MKKRIRCSRRSAEQAGYVVCKYRESGRQCGAQCLGRLLSPPVAPPGGARTVTLKHQEAAYRDAGRLQNCCGVQWLLPPTSQTIYARGSEQLARRSWQITPEINKTTEQSFADVCRTLPRLFLLAAANFGFQPVYLQVQ